MSASVLIVDDSLTVRMDLGEAFQGAEFAATLCGTLAEARHALGARSFDCVVLDVVLPDGDGVELLKEIKAASTDTPVMLLSSEQEVASRIRGMRTGADEYVGKPYDRSHVLARARALVRRHAPRDAGDRPRVLLIDDSRTFRESLRESLEEDGYAVAMAESGEAGLLSALDLRPTAIIVDGQMAGIDGATVVRRIRADAVLRRTPCILLTASDDGEVSRELDALEAGADLYLRKETDTDVVLARLGALLRASAPGTSRPQPQARASTASLLAPKKILVVDDSLTYLHEVAAHLRRDGYEVVLASSGEEALALLEAEPVDCILLDLEMPGMSGREACKIIKSTPAWRSIPVVIHTSRDERASMIEGINAGADDYITKSSDLDVLLARLRAQLRRRQLEDENRNVRELELQNRHAEQSNRLKSEFLANMSHELRTPLNAIIGFAQLLHDGVVPASSPKHNEYLGHILTSGQHLLQLINDVLDLAKVEAGKMVFVPEPVDVVRVAAEVIMVLQGNAAKKSIRVELEAGAPALEAVIDAGRLKQVLYNFLSNAIKFTPEGGRVTVRMRADGADHFVLEVEDSGIGIAEGDVGRLFVEFEQLDTGVSRRYVGTGLGLAFSKRLVEAQGGTVGVRSTLGAGSTFFARLPLRTEAA